jgi:agmatine deiminase
MMQATQLRMPAEWEAHEQTIMSWPTLREIWGDTFDQAKAEYAETARAIRRFEPVLMVVNPGDERDAAKRCGPGIDVVSIPIDDSWMRDSGPIITRDAQGRRIGVRFRFNAYGDRFLHAQDAFVGVHVLEHMKIDLQQSELVLEGGSISVDGAGTLVTTEQCLLNANRNPGWTREEIERELCRQLGVQTIIWLRWGRTEDLHTDGHVDLVCMFIRPSVVIAQGCDDSRNPNHERLQANLRILRSATDASGNQLQVVELPLLPLAEAGGQTVMVSNANFYFVNGGLIVPVAGGPDDDAVLDLFRRTFPEREIVSVPSRAIARGGGGTHCITQQIPAVK